MLMSDIIQIKGNVKFPITLDPGVWIFDDRRIDLNTYFDQGRKEENIEEDYVQKTANQWQREIQEGAVFPPTLKTEQKFEKEKVLTGTFGMPLKPFLSNAEPLTNAKTVVFETENGEVEMPIEKAEECILAFSKEGKPLKEDGPVHIIYGDGSNRHDPIKKVRAIIVK
jgi:hypothetical protein